MYSKSPEVVRRRHSMSAAEIGKNRIIFLKVLVMPVKHLVFEIIFIYLYRRHPVL